MASRRRFASRGPTNVVRIEASLSEDTVVPVEVLPMPEQTEPLEQLLEANAERPRSLKELLPSAARERLRNRPVDRQLELVAEKDQTDAARDARGQAERFLASPVLLPPDVGTAEVAPRVVRREFERSSPVLPTDVSPAPAVQFRKETPRERKIKRTQPTVAASVVARPAELAGFDDQPNADFSSNPPPSYPSRAISKGWEGVVLLQVEVDASGRVMKVDVLESSGHTILDAAAVEAVQRWRGEPAKRWGRAVSSTERLPIRFRL